MKKLSLLLLCGLVLSEVTPQSSQIEKLKGQLKQRNTPEKQALFLFEMIEYQGRFNVDSCLVWCKKIIQHNSKHPIPNIELQAKRALGNYFTIVGKFDSAVLNYERALELAKNIKDSVQSALLYVDLAGSLYVLSERRAAKERLSTGILLAKSVSNEEALQRGYYWRGKILRKQGEFDSSLFYSLKALELARKLNTTEYLVRTLESVHDQYLRTGKLVEAKAYLYEAIEVAEKNEHPRMLALALLSKAAFHIGLNEMKRAIETLHRVESLTNQVGDFMSRVNFEVIWGEMYQRSGQKEEAKERFEKAHQIAMQGGENNLLLSLTGFKLGEMERKNKNFSAAKPLLEKALEIAEATGDLIGSIWIQEGLIKLAITTEDYKSAFEHTRKVLLKNKLMNQKDLIEAVEEMQTKYETEKKDKELALKDKRNHRKNFLIAGGAVLLIFGAFFLHQERNRRQKERKLAKAEKELLHTEQEKLLAQIETKNKELAAKAVSVIKKNKLLIDIRGQLKESLRRVDNHSAQNFRTLNHSIDANLSVDKDWEDFRFQFEKSYPDFIGKLEVKYPSLTEYDRKLCAYLLIGLPVKDIADALHIAHSSAKSSRTRLRKKLNTPQGVELKEFLKEV